MALASTTLSTAAAAGDSEILVASATGIEAKDLVRVNGEIMTVIDGYDNTADGTRVKVRRGTRGTAAAAHVAGAAVTHGQPDEWGDTSPGAFVPFPASGIPLVVDDYVAAGAITLPQAGETRHAVLVGTDALAMTIADPDEAITGSILIVSADGAAAHTLTFASGLSGASTSYDVLTFNGTGPVSAMFIAVKGYWHSPVQAAMAGTLTNVTATLA